VELITFVSAEYLKEQFFFVLIFFKLLRCRGSLKNPYYVLSVYLAVYMTENSSLMYLYPGKRSRHCGSSLVQGLLVLDQCISLWTFTSCPFACTSMGRKRRVATREDFNYEFGPAEIILWDS